MSITIYCSENFISVVSFTYYCCLLKISYCVVLMMSDGAVPAWWDDVGLSDTELWLNVRLLYRGLLNIGTVIRALTLSDNWDSNQVTNNWAVWMHWTWIHISGRTEQFGTRSITLLRSACSLKCWNCLFL